MPKNRLNTLPTISDSQKRYLEELLQTHSGNVAYALRDAIVLSHYAVVDYLLKESGLAADEKVTIDATDKRERPFIYFAISTDNLEMVKLLIKDYKSKYDRYDYCMGQSMFYAMMLNKTPIVSYLLQQGGNAKAHFLSEGNFLSYLAKAALEQNHELVDILIQYGASPNAAIRSLYNNVTDKSVYQQALKLLLDHAVGVDLACDDFPCGDLKFLHDIKLTGINLLGISRKGAPLVYADVKSIAGAESALLRISDLEMLDDEERKTQLRIRINEQISQRHGAITSDGVVDLVPLWMAAQYGNLNSVVERLKAGADPNEQGPDGEAQTPITLAAERGHKDVVMELAVHRLIERQSIQKVISLKKNPQLSELLSSIYVEQPLDVDALDDSGNGLIHTAVKELNINAIESLILQNADLNLTTKKGQTALSIALEELEYIKKAQDIEKITKVVQLLLANKVLVEQDHVCLALQAGNAEIASLLISKLEKIENDDTPWYLDFLFTALEGKQGAVPVLKMLHQAGADFNCPKMHMGTTKTLLHYLLRLFLYHNKYEVSLDILKFILDAGADPHALDDKGYVPFHHMLLHYDDLFYVEHDKNNTYPDFFPNIIKELQNHGFDINCQGPYGESALHLAVRKGYTLAVRALIQLGADVNQVDDDLESPLHYAASRGQAELVKLLLEKGANAHAVSKEGITPLQKLISRHREGKNGRRFYSRKEEADFDAPYEQAKQMLSDASIMSIAGNVMAFFEQPKTNPEDSSNSKNLGIK